MRYISPCWVLLLIQAQTMVLLLMMIWICLLSLGKELGPTPIALSINLLLFSFFLLNFRPLSLKNPLMKLLLPSKKLSCWSHGGRQQMRKWEPWKIIKLERYWSYQKGGKLWHEGGSLPLDIRLMECLSKICCKGVHTDRWH